MGNKSALVLEAQEITSKQACSYVFMYELHQNTCLLVFSPFSAYFYPPMDNGLLGEFLCIAIMINLRTVKHNIGITRVRSIVCGGGSGIPQLKLGPFSSTLGLGMRLLILTSPKFSCTEIMQVSIPIPLRCS